MGYRCFLVIECYQLDKPIAHLKKIIELPFVPYPELKINMQRRGIKDAADESEYIGLATNSCDPNSIIQIEGVTYHFPNPSDQYDFWITTRAVNDEDVDRLTNYIQLWIRYYGFEVDWFDDVSMNDNTKQA